MSPNIQALLVLQDRDRRLRTLAEDLDRVPKDEARAKERLAGDEAAVRKAKEEAERVLTRHDPKMSAQEAEAQLAMSLAQLQALERLRKNMKH